ncbi:reverse transcriptase domain-containing protein [Desulfovibrio piger]|uniref:reverse transcriptase domain-containing protein n=1 Tax=Desulfovibrio piger TaxID=901 RepID=UPI0026ED64E9|nr:reverse transcriptase domain-containing protein [Desulfovibrio piger]
MQHAIKLEIKRISRKYLSKIQKIDSANAEYQDKFRKRTGLEPFIRQHNKSYVDKLFSPSYCARNANFLAKVIWYKIKNHTYEPKKAVCYKIPKPAGGHRDVMAFAIPDAAVANVIFRRIVQRNLNFFSPFSFAYNPQKNIFSAIESLNNAIDSDKKFVIQIDFEKYFDSIPITYLDQLLNSAGIRITRCEKYLFKKFMFHTFSDRENYSISEERRFKGTPQGTSISLFLANLANHELDISLTEAPGRFVRFADDIVAISSTYEEAQNIEACFHKHCKISGLKININKSPGIAILSKRQQELKTINNFDYLGYRFTPEGLIIPEKTILKLKKKISRLINIYLITYLKYEFNSDRVNVSFPIFDWDLVGFICELRHSLYGGLTEQQICEFIDENKPIKQMKGLMSFYCLIENPAQFIHLDGWMLNITRRAMAVRNNILQEKYGKMCPIPSRRQLIDGTWFDQDAWRGGTTCPEIEFPSMLRGWKAARKYFLSFGLRNLSSPPCAYYSDLADLFDYR